MNLIEENEWLIKIILFSDANAKLDLALATVQILSVIRTNATDATFRLWQTQIRTSAIVNRTFCLY